MITVPANNIGHRGDWGLYERAGRGWINWGSESTIHAALCRKWLLGHGVVIVKKHPTREQIRRRDVLREWLVRR